MTIPRISVVLKRMAVFFLFLLLVLAMYSPLINKSFASDDFAVLRRVVFAEHGIFIKGFFRPLSDITLYSNYLLVGFNPILYNLFNLAAHACIVYMVFLIAGRIAWIPAEKRLFFSWLSALLFLTYPFHNESVIWGVGRASLMAALFGTMALLAAVSAVRIRWKYFLVCLFYFIGLSGYESIMMLPGIILLLVYDRALPLRSYIPWVLWMGVTLVVHLVVRVLVSGVLLGAYGNDTMFYSTESYVMKYAKVIGRVLLPPMEHSALLVGLFVVLVVVLGICTVLLWRKRKNPGGGYSSFVRFSGMVFLTMLIPLMFGISTRTYEGDRLFYFPSIIIAWWLAWLVITLLKNKPAFIVAGVLLVYQLVFSIINIHNWYRASEITTQVISVIKDRPKPLRRVLIVNIPQEYEGAHVLRNGFYDALWLEGVDTSRVTAVNYITTEQMRRQPPVVRPAYKGGRWFIAPGVTIGYGSGQTVVSGDNLTGFTVVADTLDTDILYWNKEKLTPLYGPSTQ